MKKNIQLFLVIIIISSCNHKKYENLNSLPFNELVAESDQIVIKLHDSTVEKQITSTESNPKKIFKVSAEKIDGFKSIFESAQKTGYCCCPTSNYSISLLDNNEEFGLFYVDTTEYKGKVRIYDCGYQYSYILEEQKWKRFLNETGK
ncbi:hypothetical protein DMB65_21365 [Flavobacterium cheongpyeongense]|uniref:Lipoprotein n=1 Tax=Flavobacterium cheongpyeongense TaxID=2212651 RepID=A0A2V4BIH3_9FLAO|nr:hypothetical protein [Flavobacterium cheongpyeongense]PXY38766.1 hypothetical protein DMB65_21365 [Flavobacterium cheongpyeongense]